MKIERSVAEQRKLDRFGRCEKARIAYAASGVDPAGVDNAVSEVFSSAPDFWENLPKYSAEILRSPGGGILEIGVNYLSPDYYSSSRRRRSSKHAGDRVWRIEVNSCSVQKRCSRGCILSLAADPQTTPRDPGLLVDWNGRYGAASASENVETFEPEITMLCTATFRRSKAESRAYIRQVAELVGKVNSEAFHHWHAGEVLFTGLVRSTPFEGKSGEDLCDLTFRFNISCGGERSLAGIQAGFVEGWDRLWGLPSPDYGGIASIHVSRLYERASFAVLEL